MCIIVRQNDALRDTVVFHTAVGEWGSAENLCLSCSHRLYYSPVKNTWHALHPVLYYSDLIQVICKVSSVSHKSEFFLEFRSCVSIIAS